MIRHQCFCFHLIILTVLVGLSEQQIKADLFPLSIIHINDFHARFEATDISGGTCDDDEVCIGGYARTVYTVKRLLDEHKDTNAVYFNAGDSFQGTLWYNVGRWNVTSQFLNMLPADAMTLGNHEFDHGVEGVAPFLDAINTNMLVANMDSSNEPDLIGKYQNSTIIERSNRKIGVIGVILETTYDLANTGKLIFRNESETIVEEAAKLKAQGANIIIVISHCGYEVDKEIAEHAGSEIDVIIGSHSHTFLYTGDNPPGPDKPRGDYPTQVTHASGHRVLIVQAAAYAKYVGNITVYFDDDGNVVEFEGAPIYMGSDVPEDPEVVKAMKPWKEDIDAQGKVIVGETLVDLLKYSCGYSECNLGSFFCDAMTHAYVRLAPYDQLAWTNAPIGLVNIGALRVPLYKGNPDALALLPIWKDIIETQGRVKIGETKVNLENKECEYNECNIGNFYTEAILHKLFGLTPYYEQQWTNVSIALAAAGEISLTIPKGDITYGQVFNLCPFESPLVAFNLQGVYLKAALEKSIARIDVSNNLNSTNTFLQVSGLKIIYNLKNPVNGRVVSVKVRCADCEMPSYEDLQDDKVYRILATKYTANGGYGFSIFKEYGTNHIEYFTEFVSLLEYVDKMSPIYTGVEGRITML